MCKLLRPPQAQPSQDVVDRTSLEERLQAVGANVQLVLAHPELQSADRDLLSTSLEALSDTIPRRSLGSLLERHPPLLAAPVGAWVDFLASFGFQRLAIQELLLNSPDVLTSSSIFRAGQVFLFLRQLGLPNEQIVGPIFRWRSLLAEGVDYRAAAAFLTTEGGVAPPQLARLALDYPALLAAPVEGELRPRLGFLRGLEDPGAGEAVAQLRGVLYEEWCGWIHGVANWSTAVAPKLAALEGVLGGRQEVEALLRRVPGALKYPPESRLVPNLRLLREVVGLEGESLAALLRGAPAILSLAPEQLESRWTFLTEAANGSETDLLAYPPYLMASLAKVTGPRLFYASLRNLTWRLTQPPPVAQGGKVPRGPDLDLRWLCEGSDEEWLRRVAEVQREQGGRPGGGGGGRGRGGARSGSAAVGSGGGEMGAREVEVDMLLRGDYEEVVSEWESMLGWCCDKAFTRTGRKRFEEQLSLFYLLVQG